MNQIENNSFKLECPVCLEIPLPPIILCCNGHSICSLCKAQISDCPICREKFSEMRNFALESIVNDLHKIPCKFENCRYICKAGEFESHSKSCGFRDLYCDECKLNIGLNQYIDHLVVKHGIGENYQNPCSIAFEIDSLKSKYGRKFIMYESDETFIINVIEKGSHLFVWIVQNQISSSKFSAKLLFYEKGEDEATFQINLPIFPLRTRFSEIKTKIFIFQTKFLEQFSNYDPNDPRSLIEMAISIKKLETPSEIHWEPSIIIPKMIQLDNSEILINQDFEYLLKSWAFGSYLNYENFENSKERKVTNWRYEGENKEILKKSNQSFLFKPDRTPNQFYIFQNTSCREFVLENCKNKLYLKRFDSPKLNTQRYNTQLWKFIKVEDQKYRIVNVFNGKMVYAMGNGDQVALMRGHKGVREQFLWEIVKLPK